MRRHAKASSAGPTTRQATGLRHHRIALACLLALLAFTGTGASSASAAVTAKGVNGFFGSSTGEVGGQLNTPRGTAVNQANGNVYVADSSNNRISVFGSSGAFLRAFGQDVISSGPDNNGTDYEICVAASGDACKKGIFTASTGGATQNPQGVAVDASGNVYVSEQSKIRVQKFDANGNFILAFGQDVVGTGPGNSPAASAVQTLTVTADGGKYKLKFAGQETAELAFDSTAAQLQTALTDLSSIGAANATVAETATRVYQITFAGNLANNPEPPITTESGPGEPLTNGIATILNTTSGSSGFEVCVAANGDVCTIGVTAETGGGFKSTFNGQLSIAPAGAPNAGNVLVADPANLRVQEYTPAGAFVRAFGFDVAKAGAGNTGTAFEVCAAANGDACKIGITGSGSGQFVNSVNRVVEDADGNLYTLESGGSATTGFRVQRFTLPGNVITPQGVFCSAVCKGTATTNAPLDLAIDPASKDLLVTKAFAAGATPSCLDTGAASVQERRVLEVSQAGALEATHMACAGINVVNGLAVRGSTGEVFVTSTTVGGRIYVLNTPLATPSVGFSSIDGLSAHEASVEGFGNPNGPASLPYGFTTGYHVNYKRSSDSAFLQAPTVGIDLGRATSNKFISQPLLGLEAGTTYEVQIVAGRPFGAGIAKSAIFSFTTPAAPAEVGIPSATTAATANAARAALWGRVTPNSQATTYRFEYGTTSSYGTKVPAPDASVGAGAADVPVAQYLDGLQPNTTYHFRIVAKNASGASVSPDRTFTTPPPGGGLPDDRAPELVSPADKGPQGSVAEFGYITQVFAQSSLDGDSFAYPLQNGVPDSSAGGWARWRADRSGAGWLSTQLSPPSLIAPPKIDGVSGTSVPSKVLFVSPDLSCRVVETYNPLTEDTPQQSVEQGLYNLYVWTEGSGYRLVTNRVPLKEAPSDQTSFFGERVDAADDCSRVYFRDVFKLELIAGASGLYEWDEGTLRDAGVLPDGAPGAAAVPGGETTAFETARWNALSPDGSRFFFSAIANAGPSKGERAIFMREEGGAGVVEISASKTSVPATGARYEAASPDGGHVFFRANYGLTPTSSAGPTDGLDNGNPRRDCGETAFAGSVVNVEKAPCDLYDYDVETGELTDLSADPNPADAAVGAQVQGTVAISDDGSYAYFAALGQLVPGKGRTYAENTAANAANVYLTHDGELSFVANLGRYGPDPGGQGEFADDLFGSILMRRAGSWRANVSADGHKLLFTSSRNLTGYHSGSDDRVEAYLYSADADQLTCVSCLLDGSPSISMPASLTPDFLVQNNQSLWRLANTRNPGIWYRPRSMSEDGSRVFFTSPNVLTPGATPEKKNIYQWENGQVHFLATVEPSGGNGIGEYLDSSASGDDVFFATRHQLVPEDRDFTSDVYDLRAGGGFPTPPPPPVPCDPGADRCQGTPAPQPSASSPASTSLAGAGNVNPAATSPCPKGKVRRRGKCRKPQRPRAKQKQHKRNRAAKTDRGGAK